jgi:hypothetical protein
VSLLFLYLTLSALIKCRFTRSFGTFLFNTGFSYVHNDIGARSRISSILAKIFEMSKISFVLLLLIMSLWQQKQPLFVSPTENCDINSLLTMDLNG